MAKINNLKECKQVFERAIAENFDGMRLNDGFLDALIEQYGMESLLYLCALTIADHDTDGHYSRRNKEWAKSIDIAENECERRKLDMNTHPAVLNGIIDILLKRNK